MQLCSPGDGKSPLLAPPPPSHVLRLLSDETQAKSMGHVME